MKEADAQAIEKGYHFYSYVLLAYYFQPNALPA